MLTAIRAVNLPLTTDTDFQVQNANVCPALAKRQPHESVVRLAPKLASYATHPHVRDNIAQSMFSVTENAIPPKSCECNRLCANSLPPGVWLTGVQPVVDTHVSALTNATKPCGDCVALWVWRLISLYLKKPVVAFGAGNEGV